MGDRKLTTGDTPTVHGVQISDERSLTVSGTLRFTTDEEGNGWWELVVDEGNAFPAGTVALMESLWAGHNGERVEIEAQFARRKDG
jgi:hypothetical protein